MSTDMTAAAADNCSCDTCRAAAPDRSGPRVLTSVDAFPGESLIGLIARTSAANWIPKLRSVLAATTSCWHVHFNLAARDDVDFSQLAFACKLPPHEVEERRYRPNEIMHEMPGVVFHGATIPAYDLKLRACRVAPSWLRAGYHSALGHYGLATHCPRSGELLIDACPRCGTVLNWTRSKFHFCSSCGLNLTLHQGRSVSDHTVQATRLMLELVHPDPAIHAAAKDALHSSLLSLDRGLVFEIGWRMGCVLTGHSLARRDLAKCLPVASRLLILEAGSAALADWPHSLTKALQGIAPGRRAPSAEIALAVRSIPTSTNAWPELKAAFRQAAPGQIGGLLRAVKATLSKGVNSRELESALGVNQRVVERLRSSTLTAAASAGEVNSHEIFEAAGLEQLREQLQDRISVGTIAERLDISRHGVEQLACLGELTIHDTGPLRAGFLTRQATRSEFDSIYQTLERMGQDLEASDTGMAPPNVTMHSAMRTVGGTEKPWGPVILAMLKGDLKFALERPQSKRFMNRVRIAAIDVCRLAAMSFDRRDHQNFVFEASINGRDAEELLNVYPRIFQKAKAEKLIMSRAGGLYDRQEILELAARYMSPAEIIARCSESGRTLPPPFAGANRLAKECVLGWRRADAEPLITPSAAEKC